MKRASWRALRIGTEIALIALLTACTSEKSPEPLRAPEAATGTATASAARRDDRSVPPGTLPPREGDDEISRKLEEQFQRGELETYTPVGYELVTMTADGKTTVERLPQAIHKHGEKVNDAWMAPDGTLFAAGFMYTGVPGPDTGVVYAKAPGGPVGIVYTKAENELGTVWGLGANDVYASGNKLLVHWDGKTWSEIPLSGVEGMVRSVWGSASDLWIVSGEQKGNGFIYRRSALGPWKKEASGPWFLFTIHGAGQSVWAGGWNGQILRRDKAGTWSVERKRGRDHVLHLWAKSDHEVYAAGDEFLRSDGSGAWSNVDLPPGRIFQVTGAENGDVYALGTQGVFRSSGAGWSKTPLDATACTGVVARGGTVVCLREKRVWNKKGAR